jgi:hypothetical protein
MKCRKKMIELREVSIREVQADEVRGAWLAAFFPADFHDLENGMILEPPAIAEEGFCSAACIMMVGM